MRIFYVCILGFYLSGYTATFLPGSEDIPLMPGMKPQGTPVVFDKVSGHIFSATVDTQKTSQAILQFYDGSLKNLGWTKIRKGRYRRGNQLLWIKIQESSTIQSVHFELSEDLS